MNGVLIIDKPCGLTSHDVVNRARRILGQRSIGHLGTLDPMATGILPLVTGSFTRLAQFYLMSEKTYEGTIRFGFSTDTYDAEGEPTSALHSVTPTMDQLQTLAAKFRGTIEQTPPPFSAKKIKGVPAYKLARKQKEVVLKPVQVEIKEFEILSVDADRARFRARVTSGTYMRCVAHDMGQALGGGAHLETLRRTSVAEFTLADAHTLEEVAEAAGKRGVGGEGALARETLARRDEPNDALGPVLDESPEGTPENSPPVPLAGAPTGGTPEPLHELFIHPRRLLPQFPSVTADEPTAGRIRSGRTVNLPELSRARQVKVFSGQRDLIAIATRVAGTLFHPKIVLCG
ncbi:MAG TPA: tRNA pseudouridine(55) synthase TruB [Candidatus Dormibacteraeota bacterium]|nr:tRNA pseudouridine(55) synthase TruB [Candidatus Dormibacteraeota bacterium]